MLAAQDAMTIAMLCLMLVAIVTLTKSLVSLIVGSPTMLIAAVKAMFSGCIWLVNKSYAFALKRMAKKENVQVLAEPEQLTPQEKAKPVIEKPIMSVVLEPQVDYSVPAAIRNGAYIQVEGDLVNALTLQSVFSPEVNEDEVVEQLSLAI